MVSRNEVAKAYPFFKLDDIVAGSLSLVDEGHFDAPTMLKWQQRKAREYGAEYIQNEVVAIKQSSSKVDSVLLESSQTISAGTLVNAAGSRARLIANMVGVELPVERAVI